MTLRERVYQDISTLSDSSIRIVLALTADLHQQEQKVDDRISKLHRQKLLQEMLEMRERSTYPSDIDYRKELEDALEEKYGRFA